MAEETQEMERILLQMQILQPAVRLAYLGNKGFALLQALVGMTQQMGDLGMVVFRHLSTSKDRAKSDWGKILTTIEQQRYTLLKDISSIAQQLVQEYKPKE